MDEKNNSNKFYNIIWRWHFYAGLFVIPFLLILATTGMAMMFLAYFDGRDGENIKVSVPTNPITLSLKEQSSKTLLDYPNSKLIELITAVENDRANVFRIKLEDTSNKLIAINPYNGDIIDSWQRRSGWYDLVDSIHSDLLLGTTGDRILEITAGFSFILIISGFYLWWPRNKGINFAFIPNLSLKGRAFWMELHKIIGLYISIFFVLFLLSGMSWTGIWGGKIVQAWSTFPAEKWKNVPLSDKTHLSLTNGSAQGMPWAIEQTKLPISGSNIGTEGVLKNEIIDIDSIVRLATRLGFEQRYRISFPQEETSVWTINQDTMDGDADNPFADKTVHIDRYTGKVLAKVTFDDYSIAGKTMAVSIPLHMGLVTVWNLIINTLICLFLIVLCISGIILWWKRRPKGSGFKLSAPTAPTYLAHFKGAMLVTLALSLFFPLVGLTLITVLVLDIFIFSKIGFIKKFLN